MEKFLTNIINSPEFLIFSIIIGTVFLLCLGSVVYLVCKIREHRNKHHGARSISLLSPCFFVRFSRRKTFNN